MFIGLLVNGADISALTQEWHGTNLWRLNKRKVAYMEEKRDFSSKSCT
jgi:hypothetical protein